MSVYEATDQFFREHCIAEDVRNARNYVRWTVHKPELGQKPFEDLNEAQRRWVETVTTSSPAEIEPWQRKDGCKGGYLAKHPSHADQFVSHVEKRRVMRNGKRVLADVKVWEPTPDATYGGWVITRYAPPGLDLPHVYPELRPDAGIRVKVTQHTHRLDWPRDKGEPMSEAQTEHIDRHRQRDDHHGVNPGDWRKHNHVQIAKYLFAQTEKVKDKYEHDHATERKFIKFPKKLENHLKKDHKKDPDVVGPHSHKYKHKSNKTWANLAVRIDMHPLAVERFDDAQTVYFVIEGCLKNDAILSFVREHDLKASVLSVPSVTMWDAPELPMLIEKYLRGRRVIIVPDADWAKNPLVSSEARFLRRVLIEHGVRQVYVGSVPVKVWEQDNGIKGIDDWLAVGGDLADLQIVHNWMTPDP